MSFRFSAFSAEREGSEGEADSGKLAENAWELPACSNEKYPDSYEKFIKWIKFRTYLVHTSFTQVNIHPSEVNYPTFFLWAGML